MGNFSVAESSSIFWSYNQYRRRCCLVQACFIVFCTFQAYVALDNNSLA